MRILLTNDDGLLAPGLLAAYEALAAAGHEVTACAPAAQRSAASHSITVPRPFAVERRAMPDGRPGFAVHGTPADCARLGLKAIMEGGADLAISGINDGYNLGFDINYSGTVGAAMEAAAAGCPALAVSAQAEGRSGWGPAVAFMLRAVAEFPGWDIPKYVAISLNVPTRLASQDWVWAPPHPRPADDFFSVEEGPGGTLLYARQRGAELRAGYGDTDLWLAEAGFATLSPLVPHGYDAGVLERHAQKPL